VLAQETRQGQEASAADVANMGLEIAFFTIKDVHNNQGESTRWQVEISGA
jgi:hypothetical protein